MTDISPSAQRIQVEETAYRGPVSENLASRLGASINALINSLLPVGSYVHTCLTETQYQAAVGNLGWILADGRSIVGSELENLTGLSVAPDLRGLFLRGKQGARSSGGNSAGDLAIGAYSADHVGPHTHHFSIDQYGPGINPPLGGADGALHNALSYATNSGDGLVETAPRNITSNIMLRIN